MGADMVRGVAVFWRKFSDASINKKIFSATVLIGFFTLLAKLGGFGKELFVAARFGTSADLDAYLIALVVPSFIINVIAGSFSAAFIPTYVHVRERKGAVAADDLFNQALVWSFVLLLVLSILTVVLSPMYLPLVASGFDEEKISFTSRLIFWVSPMILLNGLILIFGAVLNAKERFALTSFIPILTPALMVCFLVLMPDWGIYVLVSGLLFGLLFQLLLLAATVRGQLSPPCLQRFKASDDLIQVGKQYVPMVFGALLMGSTGIVDQAMAAMLTSGSVASLSYGNKVIAFPLGLIGAALGTAVIPYFSKMVASNNWTDVKHSLNRYLPLIFLILIPVSCLLYFFSYNVIETLFQRGSFTEQNTIIVSRILAFYALQIPFYVAAILLVRLVSALKANHILMWGALVNLIANILLNYWFMKFLGVAGIALSTACVYLVSFSVICMYIFYRIGLEVKAVER